jgi:Ca2+-binding EF-hand superfamily protein
MTLEYSVTESITRLDGTITAISYEFEEFNVAHAASSITRSSERRSRIFDVQATRQQYNQSIKQNAGLLSFDNFVLVLRPFMMGYYLNDELEQAFKILDTNKAGHINIDKLVSFLPIINEHVTIDSLKQYVKNINYDNPIEDLTYDDYRTLILKGVGREIICHHI